MKNFFCDFTPNEDLKKHCSMHVGGKAKWFVSPKTIKELKSILRFAKFKGIKYFILGNGTNVIFNQNGYDGIVISLKNLCEIQFSHTKICAMAGVGMYKFNTFLARNNLSGLEWSYGIPGTIGGAVCMNAGAYGEDISKFVKKVEVVCPKTLKTKQLKNPKFFYRDSVIKQNKYIVTRVWLSLFEGNKEEIQNLQKKYLSQRKLTQPLEYYNSGSIFKKIDGESAGKIIDNLGLKNVKIGGAQISDLHANFIINKGEATSQDVLELIDYIKKQVGEKTNKKLECEVEIVGE